MIYLSRFILTILFISMFAGACSDSGPTGSDNEDEQETITYNVEVNVTPSESGTISPSENSSFEDGETIQFQANPEDGYIFSGWSGDLESSENPLSLTIDRNYSLTANFELKNYELTLNTEGEGQVLEQVVQAKTTEYEHGTLVELTAEPDEGWRFIEWQGELEGSENPVQITIDNHIEITAVFEPLFTLHDNEVTVLCPYAEVGATGTINGIEYTKRSKELITPENASSTCTSGITDMSQLFYAESMFNEDISHWDVSSVTDMSEMFYYASRFNQELREWDVSNVENMTFMFRAAAAFNQDIGSWDVSDVTNMSSMFFNAINFNQDLGGWDLSSATNIGYMFRGAKTFNQDIGNWDVSNVTTMYALFALTESFNQDISGWDVGEVTNMGYMFSNALAFNQDLTSWCVQNIDSEPFEFISGNSVLEEENKPNWGTCPD
jgi:surface protein